MIITSRQNAHVRRIASLKEKKKSIEARKSDSEASYRIKKAVEVMEDSSSDIIEWDESIIRQVIDGVKVLSVDEILVRIRGGIEIRQRME